MAFFGNKKSPRKGYISFQMVAQAGIEPATHGFSVVSCNKKLSISIFEIQNVVIFKNQ